MKKNINLFISYSWDSIDHENWVIDLANKLIENGINVILDKYELKLGNDLFHFMEKSVKKADKVLLILTPNYKLKAEKRKGGVGFEYSIISSQFLKQKKIKFIPILKNGTLANSVPLYFESKLYLDMKNNDLFEEHLELLLREIYENPKLKKPPLGKIPFFEIENEAQLLCLKRKVVLYIEDSKGHISICKDDILYKVLKTTEYYDDVFSGDSGIVENIQTFPGTVIDKWNENGKLIVRTQLDHIYHPDEYLSYISSCTYLDCHNDTSSFFSVWSDYQMQELEIIVCFPDERVYKNYDGFKQSSTFDRVKVKLESSVKEIIYEDRPALLLKVTRLNLHDKFKITWNW